MRRLWRRWIELRYAPFVTYAVIMLVLYGLFRLLGGHWGGEW